MKEKITAAIQEDFVPRIQAQMDSVNDAISIQHVAIHQASLTLSDAFAHLSIQLGNNVKAIQNNLAKTEDKHKTVQDRVEKALSNNTLELQAIHDALSKRLQVADIPVLENESCSTTDFSTQWEDLWKHTGKWYATALNPVSF